MISSCCLFLMADLHAEVFEDSFDSPFQLFPLYRAVLDLFSLYDVVVIPYALCLGLLYWFNSESSQSLAPAIWHFLLCGFVLVLFSASMIVLEYGIYLNGERPVTLYRSVGVILVGGLILAGGYYTWQRKRKSLEAVESQ